MRTSVTSSPCSSRPAAATPSATSAVQRSSPRPTLNLLLPQSRFSREIPTESPIISSKNLYLPLSPQHNELQMRRHELSIYKLKRTIDKLKRSLKRLLNWRARMLKLSYMNGAIPCGAEIITDLFKDPPCVPLPLRDETERNPEGYKPFVYPPALKKRERLNTWILKNEPTLRLGITICGVIAAACAPIAMIFLAA